MRFGDQLSTQEKETLTYVSKLLKVRTDCPALRKGAREPMLVDENLYAYYKVYFDSRAIVVLNKSSESKSVSIPLHSVLQTEGELWQDAMSGEFLNATDGQLSVSLEPFQGKIYIKAR